MDWTQVYPDHAFARLPDGKEVDVSDKRDTLPDDPRYGAGRKPGFYATSSSTIGGRRVKGSVIGPYKTLENAKKKAEEKWAMRWNPQRRNPASPSSTRAKFVWDSDDGLCPVKVVSIRSGGPNPAALVEITGGGRKGEIQVVSSRDIHPATSVYEKAGRVAFRAHDALSTAFTGPVDPEGKDMDRRRAKLESRSRGNPRSPAAYLLAKKNPYERIGSRTPKQASMSAIASGKYDKLRHWLDGVCSHAFNIRALTLRGRTPSGGQLASSKELARKYGAKEAEITTAEERGIREADAKYLKGNPRGSRRTRRGRR